MFDINSVINIIVSFWSSFYLCLANPVSHPELAGLWNVYCEDLSYSLAGL